MVSQFRSDPPLANRRKRYVGGVPSLSRFSGGRHIGWLCSQSASLVKARARSLSTRASVVRQKMPASVKAQRGPRKISRQRLRAGLAPTVENICSVLAVAQQESGYQADPVVPGLSKIARQEIDRRAERLQYLLLGAHRAEN